ncbi:uncharacterized protein [Heptranchias perlo]|uniref:uncharacterized protein n=1 Tax=Heptranchias perlo TaxID=212740 RepID=UPI00355A0C06
MPTCVSVVKRVQEANLKYQSEMIRNRWKETSPVVDQIEWWVRQKAAKQANYGTVLLACWADQTGPLIVDKWGRLYHLQDFLRPVQEAKVRVSSLLDLEAPATEELDDLQDWGGIVKTMEAQQHKTPQPECLPEYNRIGPSAPVQPGNGEPKSIAPVRVNPAGVAANGEMGGRGTLGESQSFTPQERSSVILLIPDLKQHNPNVEVWAKIQSAARHFNLSIQGIKDIIEVKCPSAVYGALPPWNLQIPATMVEYDTQFEALKTWVQDGLGNGTATWTGLTALRQNPGEDPIAYIDLVIERYEHWGHFPVPKHPPDIPASAQ